MISSGYSIHLYCDEAKSRWSLGHTSGEPDAIFTGETWGECAQQARAAGWKISRDRQRAVCADCSRPKRQTSGHQKDPSSGGTVANQGE